MGSLIAGILLTSSVFADPQIGDAPNNARIEFIDDGLFFIFYKGHVYATDNLYHLDNCPCQED